MGEPAEALTLFKNVKNSVENESADDIKQSIFNTHTEELIIGLCGTIGSNIHLVSDTLVRILENQYRYECKQIKLSEFIRKHCKLGEDTKGLQYYQNLINNGNELRQKYGGSILSELAINEIALNREQNTEDYNFTTKRICYIIDSIKNKEELELFQLVYRDLFYFIGVFSPLELRIRNLENKGLNVSEIYKIIDRDSGEDIDFGQKVSETFIEADFFLRLDTHSVDLIETKLRRYLNLIFSSSVLTPTEHENAMYLASAAAGNSACLSRQVGACITSKDGDVLSVGWNDVPKPGGGVYSFKPQDLLNNTDKRCIHFEEGICYNDREKKVISENLTDKLIEEGLIKKDDKNKLQQIIEKSRIKELIEFSRAVHAEMLAIINASQNTGNLVVNGNLYCTTYPCHNCARHIVAAGIKNVYFIEPYRKSLAVKLHSDSITERESEDSKVRLMIFEGVSPKRYLDFFKILTPRKKNGRKISVNLGEVRPKKSISLQAIPILEKKVTEDLKEKKVIEF